MGTTLRRKGILMSGCDRDGEPKVSGKHIRVKGWFDFRRMCTLGEYRQPLPLHLWLSTADTGYTHSPTSHVPAQSRLPPLAQGRARVSLRQPCRDIHPWPNTWAHCSSWFFVFSCCRNKCIFLMLGKQTPSLTVCVPS